MAAQQPPRPWFRLAAMMRPTTPTPPPPPPTRPPAPTTVLQPPPPLPTFRPPLALPQPTTQPQEPPRPPPPAATSPPPRGTASPSPPGPVQSPAPLSLPIASPPSASTTPAPKSPDAVDVAFAVPPPPSPPPPAASASSAPSPKQNSSAAPLSPPSSAPPPSPSVTGPPPRSPVRPPPSTTPSPKVVKQWNGKSSPDQSPIPRTISHPPSPLTLPQPAQLKPDDSHYLEPIPAEAEQKTVVMHDKTGNHSKSRITKNNKNGGFRDKNLGVAENVKGEAMKMKKPSPKSSSEDERGTREVTLAGDNKGAVMEIRRSSSSSPSRKKFAQKLNDDNMISKMKEGEGGNEKGNMKMGPMDAFVNSNVQGVNNSIVYNCAYTNRHPGVHLSVSRNGGGLGAHLIKDPAAPHD